MKWKFVSLHVAASAWEAQSLRGGVPICRLRTLFLFTWSEGAVHIRREGRGEGGKGAPTHLRACWEGAFQLHLMGWEIQVSLRPPCAELVTGISNLAQKG